MLSRMCAWYLSKRKVSVIIGFEIEDATIKAIQDDAFIYNNTFTDVEYRNPDDSIFEIPNDKFKCKNI